MAEKPWKISILSQEALKPPFAKPVVHNALIFEPPRGKAIEFHGVPIDRATGEITHAACLNCSLRVMAGGAKSGNFAMPEMPVVRKTTLAKVSQEEAFKKMGIATDAGHTINKQNLLYIGHGGFVPGQNSNSVAYTLTNAIGLSYPPELENLWAPGHGRSLLPHNWRPSHKVMSMDFSSSATVFKIAEMADRHLGPEAISKDVLRSPMPQSDSNSSYFFDPKKPQERPPIPNRPARVIDFAPEI